MKNCLKTTWQHPWSKHFHQIDHLLANSHVRQFIKVTKIDPNPDCFTDHKLLIAFLEFSLKERLKPPKKYNITVTTERIQSL